MRAPLLLLVFISPLLSCCRIPPPPAGLAISKKPLWTADLNTVASQWNTPPEFEAIRRIAFASNNELVVGTDSGPFTKPNKVQAFALSAKNGEVLAKATWEANLWAYIFATAKGEYAVVTTEGMELLNSHLERTGTIARDVAADKVSPDGRYLAADKTIPGHGVIYFLDTAALKPTGTEIRDTYAWSIGDNRVAHTVLNRSGKTIVMFADGKHVSTEYESECAGVRPQFVGEDFVALLGCARVEVISILGEKVLAEPLLGGATYLAVASRDRTRFAVSQTFERPGDPPSVCAERITVFDIKSQKAVFVTENYDLKGSNVGLASGFALSPDGNSLAVSASGKVRLFKLPTE